MARTGSGASWSAPAEKAAGYGFFLFPAALGAAVRYGTGSRVREIEQVLLRQRNELARELHDTVGHRVSAIAVQAQAGRALSAADPVRALATLVTIELGPDPSGGWSVDACLPLTVRAS